LSLAISVVVPTYNRPRLVLEAVESVLRQSGDFTFQIIVIDDGSSDETRTALEPYLDRIQYIWQRNAGLNVARNRALGLCVADYIAFLDDDDVWLPFKTSLELAALARFPQAAFVHSNFYIWKPDGDVRIPDGIRTWFPRRLEWNELYEKREEMDPQGSGQPGPDAVTSDVYYGDPYYWALFSPMVLPSAAIVRRGALEGGLAFPESDPTCGDWEFFTRLARRHGGVFVPIETTLNRSHEDRWRLTRVDESIQMTRRIALIRRLWRQDRAFEAQHRSDLDLTEARCLRKLARQQLVGGNRMATLGTLSELRQLGGTCWRAEDGWLVRFAKAPLSGHVARFLQKLRYLTRVYLRG
jgi:glycosyltransferase involved in cell wall biosynthesis